jgi:hypothetical protein
MTSLWLSGSVSAAETLPVVQVGHHTKGQAPDAKGGDAKGQDAKGGKAAQAPQAPCHECKISRQVQFLRSVALKGSGS